MELKKQRFEKAKAIWLTPLIDRRDVVDAMLQNPHPALCFIGDQDCYDSEGGYNRLAANPNLVSNLYSGLNHSLEYGDKPINSIGISQNIIADIAKF